MRRCEFNKKAFVIAAMVILLCFVSVTGATYALFTSATEDGTIGINATSGSIKLDIIDASDNPSSLINDVLDFVTTSDQKEVLFEPGATYYTEGFRVKNDGTIRIQYIIYVSEDERLAADFFDAFDVWLTKDPKSKSDMVLLQEFSGRLEVGQSSEVYYLVFRMKENAKNEFQDRTFTGVGITVCGVQGNADID